MSSRVDDTGLLSADRRSPTLAPVLSALPVFVDCFPTDVMRSLGPFVRRDAGVSVTWAYQAGRDVPFVATPSVLRLAVLGAIAANALLSLIELGRVAVTADKPAVGYAVVATAATMALHLRHVAFALR